MMTSCDNSTFKISADIAGMGNQQLHIVFLGDSGVTDAFIAVNDGKFKIKGNSSEPTIVSFLDSQRKPLFRVAACGGETIEITGDINNPHHYTCKGSDVAKEWMEFESKNADLYDQPNPAPLDQAIEQYIKEHPSSLVSTLLLVADYSDLSSSKAEQLLNSIEADKRPESLIASMQQLHATAKPITQLHSMMLCNTQDDFEALVPSKANINVLHLWNMNDAARRSTVAAMRKLAAQYQDALQIADINVGNDTTGWHAVAKSDSAAWSHYWAPGSILDPAVADLHIRQLPLIIVADNQGRQLFRGSDINTATKTIQKHLNTK